MLSMLLLGCQDKYYFHACSSESWQWGKFRKFLDVSFDNARVCPCMHVLRLPALCACWGAPVGPRARVPCPSPSDGVGGRCWLCFYLWGVKRLSVPFLLLAHSPPGLCLGSYAQGTMAGCWELAGTTVRCSAAVRHRLCSNVSIRPLDSSFLAGVSGWRRAPRSSHFASLCGSPLSSDLLLGTDLRIDLLSEPTVHLRGRDKTFLVTLSARRLGNPSLPCPAHSFWQKFLSRLKLFIPLASRAHKVTVPLKFASLTSSVTQNLNVAINKLPLPGLALS